MGSRDLGSSPALALTTSLKLGRLKTQNFHFLVCKGVVEAEKREWQCHCQCLLSFRDLERWPLSGKFLCCGQPHPSCPLSVPPQFSDRILSGQASKLSLACSHKHCPLRSDGPTPKWRSPSLQRPWKRPVTRGPSGLGPWPETG